MITLGDVGFDEREILHEDGHLDDGLYKPSDIDVPKDDQPHSPADKEKPMDIDLPPPVVGDGFGDEFMGKCILWGFFKLFYAYNYFVCFYYLVLSILFQMQMMAVMKIMMITLEILIRIFSVGYILVSSIKFW